MRRYIRRYAKGGKYFFTVVTHHRRSVLCSENAIGCLRDAFRKARVKFPFKMDAIVVLPDHLHCIWQLPSGDNDFSIRWRLIKHHFTYQYANGPSWQPRFWEHWIRDEEDWGSHMDYIHYNPVKHNYVKNAIHWPYSSFRHCVAQGLYSADWGSHITPPKSQVELDFE